MHLSIMDPIRYGFIDTIIKFVEALPPLLQLILGFFITIGLFKGFIVFADFIENKRSGPDFDKTYPE